MTDTLTRLDRTIAERRNAPANASYVASLFAAGRPKIARKVGEEAVEAIVAALAEDRQALLGEAADLLFHLAVLLADAGLSTAEVLEELERREGLSGLAEKAARGHA